MPNKKGTYLFTSESVSDGHPDKVCDQISDAILDAHLERDVKARVALEAFATTNLVVLGGEVRGAKSLSTDEMVQVARQVARAVGYEQKGFDWQNMNVISYVHEQSADISKGVDGHAGDKQGTHAQGAGDQGIMFGYATNETEAYLPATLYYSHKILQNLKAYRDRNKACILGPDAKSQVTLQYEKGEPVRADSIVVSTQHAKAEEGKEGARIKEVRDIVMGILQQSLPAGWLPCDDKIHINPNGDFVIGGPDGDAGLTGRKIIVDTYGGAAPHGGGAFSGKDPSKVDRSAAYAARYLAKNVVAAGLANKCTIQLSYAIGKPEPLSLYVDTGGSGDDEKIQQALKEVMDLTPHGICEALKLYNPIYLPTASYGHFGREPYEKNGLEFFTWEKTDLMDKILAKMNK